MSQLILMAAALVAVLVLPVMFAARMVGAAKIGFGAALLAVILQVVLSSLVKQSAPDQLLAIFIAIIGGSAIYSFTLGTTLVRGFFISVIATIIAVVAIIALAGSFAVIGGSTQQGFSIAKDSERIVKCTTKDGRVIYGNVAPGIICQKQE